MLIVEILAAAFNGNVRVRYRLTINCLFFARRGKHPVAGV